MGDDEQSFLGAFCEGIVEGFKDWKMNLCLAAISYLLAKYIV